MMAGLRQERDLIGFGTVRRAPEESIDHFVAKFGSREPQAEREDVGVIPFAGASSCLGIQHSAARAPGILLAAIATPVPVKQQTTPTSARPDATASPTA